MVFVSVKLVVPGRPGIFVANEVNPDVGPRLALPLAY